MFPFDSPVELQENMYFATETFAGHPGLEQTVRLEGYLLVTRDGPVIFTTHSHPDAAISGGRLSLVPDSGAI